MLARAREAQNLSVSDVARQLKLSVHQVEALEADEFHKLPGPVFVRGFVRNYARLVKLDPEQLAAWAVDSLPPAEPPPPAPPSQDIPFTTVAPSRWPRYAAITIAVLVALLAVYELYFNEPEPAAVRTAAVAPAPSAPAPAPVEAAAPPADATSAPAEGTGPAQPQTPEAAPAAPAVAETETAPTGARQRPGPAGERQVHMVFKKESWVQIRDRSGKAIFSQLNRPGTERTVSGEPPLTVIVGNSHGVRFTYDDQLVDLAQYTKVDVARFNLE
jgi:cytoskeleton protein RodZ